MDVLEHEDHVATAQIRFLREVGRQLPAGQDDDRAGVVAQEPADEAALARVVSAHEAERAELERMPGILVLRPLEIARRAPLHAQFRALGRVRRPVDRGSVAQGLRDERLDELPEAGQPVLPRRDRSREGDACDRGPLVPRRVQQPDHTGLAEHRRAADTFAGVVDPEQERLRQLVTPRLVRDAQHPTELAALQPDREARGPRARRVRDAVERTHEPLRRRDVESRIRDLRRVGDGQDRHVALDAARVLVERGRALGALVESDPDVAVRDRRDDVMACENHSAVTRHVEAQTDASMLALRVDDLRRGPARRLDL